MLLTAAAIIGTAWFAAIWAICIFGVYNAFRLFAKRGRSPAHSPTPPVTIIRPLSGLESNLYENLESSFLQDYPHVEIILAASRANDAALPIARSLIEKYPGIDARVLVDSSVIGVNPKVNNLHAPYVAAKHDVLWVLDSNVLSDTGALSRAVPLLTDTVGLVHHVPFAIYPDVQNWGARVEQSFLCTTHAKMYIALNALCIDSCVMGKSTLWRRSVLDAAVTKMGGAPPGIAHFSKYLGEDNMIGSAIWHAGHMRHALAPDIAGNAVGSMDLASYIWRRIRWIRIRKFMTTAATLVEPFTESIVAGIVGSASLARLGYIQRPVLFFVMHLTAWFALDCVLFARLASVSPHHESHDGLGLPFAFAWLLREALALPVWVLAMLGTQISWRDPSVRYVVRADGTVDLVPPGAPQSRVDMCISSLVSGKRGKRGLLAGG